MRHFAKYLLNAPKPRGRCNQWRKGGLIVGDRGAQPGEPSSAPCPPNAVSLLNLSIMKEKQIQSTVSHPCICPCAVLGRV